MFAKLGLRLRIFLFFAFLAVAGLAAVALGLWLGQSRSGLDPSPFVTAGLVSGFAILGITAGVWLLFDEHVAKPVERLAADLRTGAEAGAGQGLASDRARYLGDLAPAAHALTQRVGAANLSAAERIAAETARLERERAHLSTVLSEIPVAVVLVSADHRISLYDGQAARALEPVAPLCLGHPLGDYVDLGQVVRALEKADADAARGADLTLSTADGTRVFEAHLRRLGDGSGYMLTLETEPAPSVQRPLVFDVTLPAETAGEDLRRTPIDAITCVVFDTETTGLLPETDEVVQIGAVRTRGTRVVEGEVFDTLVNPGRPIPATSTKVHGISDDMVGDAPSMTLAGARFCKFAQGAVLVAHNAPFDMAFLKRWEKTGIGRFDNPVLDTVLLSAALWGGGVPHTLDAIAERLGIAMPEVVRHTALGDAEATAAVLLRILPALKARGFATLGDVLDEQRRHTRILPDVNAAGSG